MSLNLQPLLDKKRLAYKVILPPEHLPITNDWVEKTVPLEQLAQIELLQDRAGIVICLYPANHEINPEVVRQILRRPLEQLDSASQEVRLAQLVSGIGAAFCQDIIDEVLTNHDTIYFRGNNELQLLAVDTT